MIIQEQHGLFPRIVGKGDRAQRLTELLQRMRIENASSNPSILPTTATMPSTTLENLIIIDRETDMASPLLTQLTYEGLLDEIFTIHHSTTEIDTSIVGAGPVASSTSTDSTPPAAPLTRKILLPYTDTLYASLRHVHFTLAGPLLNRVARRLQSSYESRHAQSTTAELKSFVQKLPAYQAEAASLKTHTSLLDALLQRTNSAPLFRASLEAQQALASGNFDATAVREAVEDLAARNAPLHLVLRLLCLESCMAGGLRARDLDNARRTVVQAYGPQHLLTLDALEKMGLLRERGALPFSLPGAAAIGGAVRSGVGRSDESEAAVAAAAAEAQPTNYYALRKPLGLLVEDVSEEDPQDIAYVYSGYAPLSVRLVQAVLQKAQLAKVARTSFGSGGAAGADAGWRGFEAALANVRGRTVDEVQGSRDKAVKSRQVLAGASAAGAMKTSVVMFVGGITFAEIAALRFIGKQEEEAGRRRVVVCTTSIISGEKMMDAAIARSRGEA
ncbi:hypothetical protein FH972_026281 [Carpinus fangiana]|uniref:Sec1-like protein n=1 Tax=Carpinus fangiana TaxID=176857 RepID=A0A5N6L4I0_9ROSI|nr:hypothetical protein FH972_026281 [Carpinus fangiana]